MARSYLHLHQTNTRKFEMKNNDLYGQWTMGNGHGVNASQTLTTKSFASRSARSVRSPKILKSSFFVLPTTTILSSTRPIRLSTYGQKHLKRMHRFFSKNNEMWYFPHLAPQLFQSKFPHSFSSRARCFYLKKKQRSSWSCTMHIWCQSMRDLLRESLRLCIDETVTKKWNSI